MRFLSEICNIDSGAIGEIGAEVDVVVLLVMVAVLGGIGVGGDSDVGGGRSGSGGRDENGEGRRIQTRRCLR
jgi:hypothetical protein